MSKKPRDPGKPITDKQCQLNYGLILIKQYLQMAERSNSWESWKVREKDRSLKVHTDDWSKKICVPECITLHICADIMKSCRIVIKIRIRCLNIFSKAKKEAVRCCSTTQCSSHFTLSSRWYLSGHVNEQNQADYTSKIKLEGIYFIYALIKSLFFFLQAWCRKFLLKFVCDIIFWLSAHPVILRAAFFSLFRLKP